MYKLILFGFLLFSTKYGPMDTKVDKWLTDMSAPLSMDYTGSSSSQSNNPTTSSSGRRANRQSSTPAQQSLSASQMSSSKSSNSQSHSQSSAAQHQQQQQQSMGGPPPGLTGDEPVPVINKQTGKRLAGNKAPQLKRLMQW